MVFLRCAGAAAVLLLSSCWTPVFNEDLSVAGLVRGKLALERTFSNVSPQNGNQDGTVFQAVRTGDFSTYVLLSSRANSVTSTLLAPLGSPIQMFNGQLEIPLPDPLLALAQPSQSEIAYFVPTLSNTVNGIGQVSVPTSNFTYPVSPMALKTNLLGFCVAPVSGGASVAYYLSTDDSTATLQSHLFPYTDPSYSPQTVWSVAYAGSYGWMAVDPAGVGTVGPTAFVTHPASDSGTYTTDMIAASGVIGSWTSQDYVVAFLTTGRLLTRQGSFYNVCDASGKRLYSFPAGSLRFQGEYFDSLTGRMRSEFSEAVSSDGSNNGQDTLRVSFYTVETDQLASLQQ